MDLHDRGSGRSRRQLEDCIARANAGERIAFVTPGRPRYWFDLAFAVATEKGFAPAVNLSCGRITIGEGCISFRMQDGPIWRDRRFQGIDPKSIVPDHGVRAG